MHPPVSFNRQQLGLLPPNLARLQVRGQQPIFGITAHITVTPSGTPAQTWRQIQREYMSGNNVNHTVYGDLPYNVGISMGGAILAGRDLAFVGAHALSTNNLANRQTIGVVFIGYPGELTPEAEAAFAHVVANNEAAFGRKLALLTHHDWINYGGPNTSCPDEPITDYVRRVAAGG